MDVAVDADPYLDRGLFIELAGNGAGEQLDVVKIIAFQHIGDDEGQVVNRNALLGVPQLDDSFQYLRLFFFGQVESQRFEVFRQRCLAAQLAQGIAMRAGKPRGVEPGFVQVAFLVSICVDAGRLGKDIAADDGCVGGYAFARKPGDQVAEMNKVLLVDGDLHIHLVAQHHGQLSHRYIARALTQAVDGAMDGIDTGAHRGHRVGDGQAIVVVRVEIKFQFRVTSGHVAEADIGLFGRHDPQGVGQHEVGDTETPECVHQAVYVFRAVDVAV